MRRIWPAGAAALAVALVAAVLFPSSGSVPRPPGRPAPGPEPCVVTGRVSDAAGRPIPFVEVRARILDPGVLFGTRTVADRKGRFDLRLFPPRGLWEVSAHPPDRPPFTGEAPLRAAPGARREVELRETGAGLGPGTTPPEPVVGGEVLDHRCRLQGGVTVELLRPGGEALATVESGSDGRFAFTGEWEAPLLVRLPGQPEEEATQVRTLPRLDLELVTPSSGEHLGTLTLEPRLDRWPGDREARILLFNSLGELVRRARRRLSDAPWRFEFIPYDACDVRVAAGDLGGVLQGFDFTPESTHAVVPVGEAARLRGCLSREAQVHLLSRSPTYVPIAESLREADGLSGNVRRVFEASKGREIRFGGLPAGDFLLRIHGPGLETIERELALAEGEVLDLGRIEVEEATATLIVALFDDRAAGGLEHAYRVTLYSETGALLEQGVLPDGTPEARFEGLSAGTWSCRVGRIADETGRVTRAVGRHRRVALARDEERRVEVDCGWRLE